MEDQKNHIPLLSVIALSVIVIGVVAYYFLHQGSQPQPLVNNFPTSTQPGSNTSQANFPQNTPTKNPLASATLDQRSLNSSFPTPTITGTFANTTGLEILISKDTLPKSSLMSDTIPGEVWSDRSDHGGGVHTSDTSSGTFSSTVTTALPDGMYTVGVYLDLFHYPKTDANIALDSRQMLTSGILTIHSGN